MPSTQPTLCIVNYNGLRHLRGSLPAAAALAPSFAEILLLDNASTDGSVAYAAEHHPEVRVVQVGDNRGPGAARNAGLAAATTPRVLFIDNDVALMPGCAETLMAALDAHPAAMVAAPRVLYAHDPARIQFEGGADNHYLGLMILHSQDRPLAEADREIRKVDGVVTACFLVDRERLGAAGGFDECFFIYYEDHDFGMRVRSRGGEILLVPAATCLHGDGSDGLAVRQTGSYSSRRVFLTIRNRWIFLLKNYQTRTLVVLAPILLVYELCQLLLVLKKGWVRDWAGAVRWVWDHRAELAAKRREIQAGRALADRELLRGGPVPFRAELTKGALERLLRRLFDGLAIGYWRVAARWL